MSVNTPLISIIMPAYNAERYIQEAIQSVLNQTYSHWELIIIDDHATDATAEMIQAFCHQDSRVHYHYAPHKVGRPAGVRNIGFQHAKGDFIACLDADDRYLPDTLETLMAALLENTSCIAVYGFPEIINTSGQIVPHTPVGYGYIRYLLGHLAFNRYPPKNWETISHSNFYLSGLLFHKRLLDQIGPLDETLTGSEDVQFYLRMFLANGLASVICLPQKIYQYRTNPTSVTQALETTLTTMDDDLKVVDWLFAQPHFPADAQQYLSMALVLRYYTACSLLLTKQCKRQLIWQRVWQGFHHRGVQWQDWAPWASIVLLRSILPRQTHALMRSAKIMWSKLKH